MAYSKITNNFAVEVTPLFQSSMSTEYNNYYVWSYNIQIENNSDILAQLVGRYWKIVNSDGNIREVTGTGVVGRKPIIKPGDVFSYTSHVNLPTSSGIMLGNYELIDLERKLNFAIEIPAFSLDVPYKQVILN